MICFSYLGGVFKLFCLSNCLNLAKGDIGLLVCLVITRVDTATKQNHTLFTLEALYLI